MHQTSRSLSLFELLHVRYAATILLPESCPLRALGITWSKVILFRASAIWAYMSPMEFYFFVIREWLHCHRSIQQSLIEFCANHIRCFLILSISTLHSIMGRYQVRIRIVKKLPAPSPRCARTFSYFSSALYRMTFRSNSPLSYHHVFQKRLDIQRRTPHASAHIAMLRWKIWVRSLSVIIPRTRIRARRAQ